MATVGERAFWRYGRVSYDVTPRLAEIGNQLYIRTRTTLDHVEVSDLNDRLTRDTYSSSGKTYSRGDFASPNIVVFIGNPSPPFHCVTSKELNNITSRLLKPTLGSRQKQTKPTKSSSSSLPFPHHHLPPPPPLPSALLVPSRKSTSANHLVTCAGLPPAGTGILRTSKAGEDRLSTTDTDCDSANKQSVLSKVRFSLREPRAKSLHKQEPRSKSAPVSSARKALPDVKSCRAPSTSPWDCTRRRKEHMTQNSKMAAPQKPKPQPKRGATCSRKQRSQSALNDIARSQSCVERPKRLGLIATILEADDECDY